MGKSTKRNSTHKSEPDSSAIPSSTSKSDKGLGNHLAETAWRVAVPFLFFSLGGIWLDNRYETDPLYTVIGVFLALAAVTAVMYKYVKTNFPEMFDRNNDDK